MNETVDNKKVIHIRLGQVNQPVVEEIKDEQFLDTAIFGDQYRQMLSMLDRYVSYRNKPDKGTDAANNVFSFVGERGSGKTSCMASVARLLTGGNLRKFQSYQHLCGTKFVDVDIIDPSYFDKSHNIVAMVIAKIYKSFRELEDADNHRCCNFDVRNDLIDAFSRTQRNMRCLLGEKKEDGYIDDDIENLADLSMAVDLKKDIERLVHTYLKFVKKDDGILVLSIDDIDLNISEADVMAEQIRKYLVSPQIVVLLAAKLDQLSTIMDLHYAEYKYLIDKRRLQYDVVEEMTSQFLAKFAPHDQRVHMPSSEFYLESGIEIDGDNIHGCTVRQAIPELIFTRTRYLFYNSKQTASYIVPRNLRKMCQLATMVYSMQPYDQADKAAANKKIFRNYLFGTWMQDNLSQEDRTYAQRLLNGWHNEQINRVALDVLNEKYNEWFKEISKQGSGSNVERSDLIEEVSALINKHNREFNISIGDVMSLVYNLQVAYESHSDKCFFFIIKSIYSMALYEAYDLITEQQDSDGYDEFAESMLEDNGQVLLYDPFAANLVRPYHKLVGGRFFNYRLVQVLSKEQITNERVSRSDRMINYKELETLLQDAVNLWKGYNAANEADKALLKEELTWKVRLAEFFMLSCIRDINRRNSTKKDFYDPNFRQSDEVYYIGKYTSQDWLYFDLGSFFYNITDIGNCYKRYGMGKELLDLCRSETEGDEISLFSSFRTHAIGKKGYTTLPHAWQSWASIRNTEVLFDLNQHFISQCREKGSSNLHHLRKYFDVLADYKIKTYDRTEDEDSYYSIDFGFASIIKDLLNNPSIEEVFNKIFGWNEAIPLSSLVQSINVDALLRRRNENRNKKSTILSYLRQYEGKIYSEHQPLISEILGGYGANMTKEEIREAGEKINRSLSEMYGSSATNAENTVPQQEAEPDSSTTEE